MPSLVMTHCPAQGLSAWVLDGGSRTGRLEAWGKLASLDTLEQSLPLTVPVSPSIRPRPWPRFDLL